MADFQGLSTAYSGIRAAQLALDTVAHNVANAGTEGYTRQRVDLTSRLPWRNQAGFVGTGVDITSINRQRDLFLDARMRTELASSGQHGARATLLDRAESLLGRLDGGINAELAELWASLDELALRPDSSANQQLAVAALDTVTARIRDLATGLDRLELDARADLQRQVDHVNRMLDDVAALNRQIADLAVTGDRPNDLLDARDRLLDDLARATGATVADADRGHARVSLNGLLLVDGTTARHLTLEADLTIRHPLGEVQPGGSIGGTSTFLRGDVATLRASVDAFAVDLAAALNGRNAAGFVAPGTPGGALLTGSSAATLQVAAGARIATALGDPPSALDGRNAASLAALRTDGVLGGESIQGRFQRMVGDVGALTRSARASASRADTLVGATAVAREGAHGVNLDEEMVSLVTFQRALEANSRVLTAIDDALATLINRTGLVGR